MVLPTFDEEKTLWNRGYEYVVGLDEVGRGCFAGPVVAASVIFSSELRIRNNELGILELGINDSKLLSPQKREILSDRIKKSALCFSIAEISVETINRYGIGEATKKAFRKALVDSVKKIGSGKIFALIDGFHISYLKGADIRHQKAIIKGDRKSISIAAASILAKVYRDNLMRNVSQQYPEYGFAIHKGYGTKMHQEALRQYGLSKLHRKSFNLSQFLT